jgi:arsenate reductase
LKPAILILCTANSARSQMAEGLFRRAYGDRFEIFSAGTQPGRVRAEAVTVMAELGIDLSGHRAKSVEEFGGREFRFVVTVCDLVRASCPAFPGGAERIHWSLEDPAAVEGEEEVRLAAFRRIRDEIQERLAHFEPPG